MKTAGLYFALAIATVLPVAAQSTAPAAAEPAPAPPAAVKPVPPAALSPEVAPMLTAVLPKYEAPPAAKPASPTDADVVELPKMTVTQKKRPRLGDSVMMTTNAFNEKLAKDRTSSFDRNFLNKFSLPSWFGGQSAADRARAEYDYEKKEQLKSDVLHLAAVAEQADPAQAKALRDAVNKP